jgi:hypothetical protein
MVFFKFNTKVRFPGIQVGKNFGAKKLRLPEIILEWRHDVQRDDSQHNGTSVTNSIIDLKE